MLEYLVFSLYGPPMTTGKITYNETAKEHFDVKYINDKDKESILAMSIFKDHFEFLMRHLLKKEHIQYSSLVICFVLIFKKVIQSVVIRRHLTYFFMCKRMNVSEKSAIRLVFLILLFTKKRILKNRNSFKDYCSVNVTYIIDGRFQMKIV